MLASAACRTLHDQGDRDLLGGGGHTAGEGATAAGETGRLPAGLGGAALAVAADVEDPELLLAHLLSRYVSAGSP